jgi:Flp pilus assembly protein TadG
MNMHFTDNESERGAAAFLVAISLVVLVGFAALAIDGGLGFDDRRGTQNAADSAALAAAWEAWRAHRTRRDRRSPLPPRTDTTTPIPRWWSR